MSGNYSFRWGVSFMDSGGLYLPGFLLRNYALAGVERLQFLTLAHISAYHYESEQGVARPSLHTIARQMGYQRRRDVRRHLHALAARTWAPSDPTATNRGRGGGDDKERQSVPMLEILPQPGKASVYIAHGIARACLEIELARVMSIRRTGGEKALLEGLRAQVATPPQIGGSVPWHLTEVLPQEGGTLPPNEGKQAGHPSPNQHDPKAHPSPNQRAEEKESFLINSLRIIEEESGQGFPDEEEPEEEPTPEIANEPARAWNATRCQLQADMAKATFDSWVFGLKLKEFDDGVFVIEAPSTYARDWNESRLASTIRRHLTGIMNQTVDVKFVGPTF